MTTCGGCLRWASEGWVPSNAEATAWVGAARQEGARRRRFTLDSLQLGGHCPSGFGYVGAASSPARQGASQGKPRGPRRVPCNATGGSPTHPPTHPHNHPPTHRRPTNHPRPPTRMLNFEPCLTSTCRREGAACGAFLSAGCFQGARVPPSVNCSRSLNSHARACYQIRSLQ